jgi:hypothetical protein
MLDSIPELTEPCKTEQLKNTYKKDNNIIERVEKVYGLFEVDSIYGIDCIDGIDSNDGKDDVYMFWYCNHHGYGITIKMPSYYFSAISIIQHNTLNYKFLNSYRNYKKFSFNNVHWKCKGAIHVTNDEIIPLFNIETNYHHPIHFWKFANYKNNIFTEKGEYLLDDSSPLYQWFLNYNSPGTRISTV